MSGQVGTADRARVHRVGRDPVISPAPRGLDGEQDVGRLGLSVGEQRVVPARGEVQIVEDHGRKVVSRRAERHDPCTAGLDQ